MGEFAYRAIDEKGREKNGRISAANDSDARQKLEHRRLYVVQVEPAKKSESQKRPAFALGNRSKRLGSKQLTLFTRQLASLTQVSPLEEALRTIGRQSEKEHVRNIIGNAHAGVVEGQRLSEAMRREQRSFPPLYRAMISAGESSGSLPDILERLADLLERQAAMRGKLLSALAYPIILSLVAILVVTGLMVSVVPRIVEQFDGVEERLPTVTRVVMAISEFLAAYYNIILILIALAAAAFTLALRKDAFRLATDRMILKLPLVGRMVRDLNAARLARTLATMVASRLPLLEGLKLTRETVSNRVLRHANDDMVEAVRSGGSLSGAMRASGVFPPLLVYLTAGGESSGQLDMMLSRAADYLEREFDNFTSAALSMLEPAIIVIMGGLVAVIILSILLPILQLQNLAGI
ncbi:type II secretion system inner membrane protein GspF [Sphingorhabdus arenilitoris]|uniref:General secretion pathway protein F n=1 Tax=Sphingorhabdus arenilitoris TaxID=1490041 RepID=A0ABV8RHX2_9SPHN